jgi:hypothetical protein
MSGKENINIIKKGEVISNRTTKEDTKLGNEKILFYNDKIQYEIESKLLPIASKLKGADKNKVNLFK